MKILAIRVFENFGFLLKCGSITKIFVSLVCSKNVVGYGWYLEFLKEFGFSTIFGICEGV